MTSTSSAPGPTPPRDRPVQGQRDAGRPAAGCDDPERNMRRALLVGYALTAWVGFLGVTLWAIAFLTDISPIPTIDRARSVPAPAAVAIDLGLIGLFAVHHSVMARPAAKRWLTRAVPVAAERSTYVLCADVLLALVLWQWRSLPASVWRVGGGAATVLWTVYGAGWAIAIASTFMIDHFDLVGLRQAVSRVYRAPAFQVRWLYRFVRHPLMLGLLIAFWVTPSMSVGHLLFAAGTSAYIAVGVRFEERDLRADLGEPYREYAATTPAIIPALASRIARRRNASA